MSGWAQSYAEQAEEEQQYYLSLAGQVDELQGRIDAAVDILSHLIEHGNRPSNDAFMLLKILRDGSA